jgi:tryptophan synthase alpha chain
VNRIDKKFKELDKAKKKAFIAYITAGDPSFSMTEKLVPALERSGVDIIELGIPFSDPLADGPTIQAASERALKAGATLKKAFALVARLRDKAACPIVFMTYYNPVLRYGPARFFDSCKSCGVDGVIVPDLPCVEAKELVRLGRKKGVAAIFLAAPTSTDESIRSIAANSSGFIYYVSLTGVTGARSKPAKDIARNVRRIKAVTDKPVAVGFGVFGPAQARAAAAAADGVIVGSAIVNIIAGKKDVVSRVSTFARSLSKAIHGA